MASKKSYGDYSVGWICALPKEQTAATAMLDERHADLPKLTNDANTYTLGSIGPHNVVIACLPKGQYGTNSAANVAAFMIRTFPSIKIGLMVGIGGGVPPKVRLGDVVISTPTGQYPGVVQWDLGKETQGGGFERTGALSNPPGALLTALAKLETENELMGSKIPNFLEELKARFPRLAKKYLKSDKLQDLLFETDYVHIKEPFSTMNTEGPTGGIVGVSVEEEVKDESDEDGDPCQFCDKSKLIKKRRRSIRVHHGLIASGNKVIKDGLRREKLNSALGGEVLCFETEAAGLMNNFPCLVIRGICDYCDSHKNNAWQEHAAAVAAAFAKELLGCIQPSDFEGERPIRDVMNEVKQDVQRLYDVSLETKKHLDIFRDDTEAKKRIEALNWLSPLDFPLIQHDYFARCAHDTGQEFLFSEQVQSWISTSKQTLFCEGVPGAGKTFQMAILVNYLTEKFRYDGSVGVAYIYYNFKRHNDQKAEHMLASLVKQLAQNSRSFPEAVQKLYDRHSLVNTRPFLVELSDTLAMLVQSYSRVFVLVDALDEAEDTERTKLLDNILLMQEKSGLNVFATSRAINTIAAKFEGSLSREISPSRHDVFQVLNARMSELPSFVREDEGLQNEIKSSIEAAMGGMFLLAQLYLNSFVGSRSLSSLKKSLSSLQQASYSSSSSSSSDRSSVLNEAYDKSMERIQQLKGDLARDAILIISWIVKAKRQMKVAELQEALAVEVGATELDRDNIPTVDHIVQACASLVVIEGEGIELVHYTAQEYFERPDNQWMQQAHTYITNTCLAYLSFSDFRHEPCLTRENRAKRIEDCPFYGYSDENWACHTREALSQGFDISRVIGFLECGALQVSWYQSLLCGHIPGPFNLEQFLTQLTPLHIVAFFGLHEAVIHLLSQGFSSNAEGSNSQLPMFWAALGGDARVVKLLLEATNIDLSDEARYIDCMPLFTAALMGREAAVEVLLDEYPIESNDDGWTALHVAVRFERQAVFDLLIEKGANIEARQNECGATPLALGAKKGCMAAVQWLVEKGANIEAKDSDNRTPLLLAILGNHGNIIRYLVEKGANIEVMDNELRTPLMLAIKGNSQDLVQYLLEKGADIEAVDNDSQTPLMLAIVENHEILVQQIVAKGANLEAKNDKNWTPLMLAITKRNRNIVRYLLERGANVDAAGSNNHVADTEPQIYRLLLGLDLFGINVPCEIKRNFTPITMATDIEDDGIVKWLVEQGADLDRADGNCMTPLLIAIQKENKHMVRLLIEMGAGLDRAGYTCLLPPLAFAAVQGKRDIVEMLIREGADLEVREAYGGETPLIWASKKGHTDIIQLLLEKGADIEARDSLQNTALICASGSGKKEAVKLLLTNNANMEAKRWDGDTALGRAVLCQSPETVRILLDKGANVEAEGDDGVTPIAHAARKDDSSMLTMLLDKNAKTDYRDDSGQTLMHIAALDKRLGNVSVLLACNTAEVDGKDNKGRTPLSHVAERGDESILKALLESEKVDANMKDDQGLPPLRYAMDRQDEDGLVLKALLDSAKVDVNAKDGQGCTPLLYAIQTRKGSLVPLLLGLEKVNVNEKDDQGRTPIQHAIDHKDEDGSILSTMLNCEKVEVNAQDALGRTPLLYAIDSKKESIVRTLLNCERVDGNDKGGLGRTPIQYAIDHKDEDGSILRALLNSDKVDVNAKDDQGHTPLHYAIERAEESLVKILLDCEKVDANEKDDQGLTPLRYAMDHKGRDETILKALLSSERVDVNATDDQGYTPLFHAIKRQDGLAIDAMLESDHVDFNAENNRGLSPLFFAISQEWMLFPIGTCKTEAYILRKLLKSGKVDLNMKDDKKGTPLQYATHFGFDFALKVLLEYATAEQVNAKDDQGRTSFRYAIELGKLSTIKMFLQCNKVNVNMKDDQGRTPLRYAVQHRQESIIRVLLDRTNFDTGINDEDSVQGIVRRFSEDMCKDAKLDANARDNQGRTPLSYAMELGDRSTVRALLTFEELDIEAKDDAGRTPLSYSASYDVARLLLKTGGIDVNSKDNQGRTPLWYAIKAGNRELEGLLRRRGAKETSMMKNIRQKLIRGGTSSR